MDPAVARRIAVLAGHVCGAGEVQEVLGRAATAAHGKIRVAVVGAAGGIGQPLALLLKLSPYVSVLHLYDVAPTAGVAADISHISTGAKVVAFSGQQQLAAALTGVDLVVIPAGVPRKPGMTRDDLFNINAGIVKNICEGIATNCPDAWINIISNPVNSTVPIAAEVLKKAGRFNPRLLFGVTHLDVMRARTFVAGVLGCDPSAVSVPVVGGHAGETILPLLSQTEPAFSFTDAEAAALTNRIQNGGTEAAAAVEFAEACARAKLGEPGVEACAYVASALTEHPFFASRVRLGRFGLEDILPLGPLNAMERAGLAKMGPELKASIDKGVAFANK